MIMRDGASIFTPAVLMGIAGLLVKITLIIAYLVKFYFIAFPNPETWGRLAADYSSYDIAGLFAALIAAPAYLLKKLARLC